MGPWTILKDNFLQWHIKKTIFARTKPQTDHIYMDQKHILAILILTLRTISNTIFFPDTREIVRPNYIRTRRLR